MKTAKIISIIGHPIFHPTWMMILLLVTGITRFTLGNDLTFLAITFAMTCLLPALVIVMLKKWHFIDSYEMDERDDRLGPLFIMTTASMRLYLLYFIGSIVISGIVAAARLKLKSHSNAQIYSGFAMGFATVIIIFFLSMF